MVNQLRQEHEERQEQDRSTDECQAHVGPARQEDPDRGRERPGQHRGHSDIDKNPRSSVPPVPAINDGSYRIRFRVRQ
jgi:hypothetical protein